MRGATKLLGLMIGMALTGMASAQAAEPIKIGVIGPTKTLVGRQGVQGATLAAEIVNREGGILGGRQIKLVTYDTNFAPAEGVAAVQRLLTQDEVKIITGEVSSTVALAAIPVVQAEGAIFIATVPKHPDVTRSGSDTIFRLNSTTAMDAESFDRVLIDVLKPDKVAVIAENSDFGRLTIDNMKKTLGTRIAFAETYGMQQSDFNTLATNARASGADLVCIAGSNLEQYGNLLRSLSALGYQGRRCLMPGILNSQGVAIAGSAANGVVSADIYVPSLPGEVNRRFVAAFEAKFGNKPEKIEMLGFESVWIAARAMDAAGTATDVAKIAAAIRGTPWETPRGRVTFDADGQAKSGSLFRLEVRDGTIVPTAD